MINPESFPRHFKLFVANEGVGIGGGILGSLAGGAATDAVNQATGKETIPEGIAPFIAGGLGSYLAQELLVKALSRKSKKLLVGR